MNLSVNGHSKVPPGFRFHPTEQELLQYYLKKKVALEKIDLDVIRDIDLNKLEPWEIQEKCQIGSGPQNDWYVFSHKDKKYPTGTRTNRATAAGFWKATGRDKIIYSKNKRIGMRKTLVFYKGRAPNGEKSDWIMHEYRLQDCVATHTGYHDHSHVARDDSGITEEGWVICRVFRKKKYQKTNGSPISSPISSESQSQLLNFSSKKAFDHLFSCMVNAYQDQNNHEHPTSSPSPTTSTTSILPTHSFYTENNTNTPQGKLIIHDNYIIEPSNGLNYIIKPSNSQILSADNDHIDQYSLPMLTSGSPSAFDYHHDEDEPYIDLCYDKQRSGNAKPRISDWMTLDRLIASQLNGQDEELLMCSNSLMFQGL